MTRYYVDSNPIRTTLQRERSGRPAIVSYSWHVRDREQVVPAPYGRYGKSVACSKDELTARRICDMMNGGIPDGRDTNFSAAEVVKLIGERETLRERLQACEKVRDDHAAALRDARRETGLQRLRGDMLRDELADARKALEQERNVSSDQAAAMRRMQNENAITLGANRELAAEIARLSTNIYAQQPQVGKPGHAFSVAIAERNRALEEVESLRRTVEQLQNATDRADRLQRDFNAADAKLSKIWDVINTEEP